MICGSQESVLRSRTDDSSHVSSLTPRISTLSLYGPPSVTLTL